MYLPRTLALLTRLGPLDHVFFFFYPSVEEIGIVIHFVYCGICATLFWKAQTTCDDGTEALKLEAAAKLLEYAVSSRCSQRCSINANR